MGILGAASLIGYRFLLPMDAIDPMWQRFLMASLMVLIVLLSVLYEDFFYRQMEKLVTGSLYVITIWVLELVWLNNMRTEYLLSYFVVLFAGVVVFSRKDGLIYFSVFNLLLATIVTFMVPTPNIAPSLFIGMIIFVLVVANATFGYFLNQYRTVEQSAETYHSLADAAFSINRDGIMLLDEAGNILEVNDELSQIWNLHSFSFIGKHHSEFAKEAAKMLMDPNILRSNGQWQFPLKSKSSIYFKLQNGGIIELKVLEISLGRNLKGNSLFFLNQTQSFNQQQELEQSNALIRATIELSGLGILVTDHHGKVVFYNDIYLKLFNMNSEFLTLSPPNEVISYCQKQLKNSDELAKAMNMLVREPQFEESRLLEFLNGKLVQRLAQKMEVGGENIGRVWFYRDVTEKIKSDEELVKRNFELDSFVYSASHDLKAPLNSLSGLLRLAREEFKEPDIAKFLEMMGMNVTRLEDFISLLTDFSRNSRMENVMEPVDLSKIMEEIRGKLRFLKESDLVRVQLEVDPTQTLISDAPRLRIILTNLISNSLRYFDPDKTAPYVKIELKWEENKPVIWVEDNGTGIQKHYHEKIFDLFLRADKRSTGSGLGLYVVRNTVERLGGSIELDTDFTGGTRFRIGLPTSKKAHSPQAVPSK